MESWFRPDLVLFALGLVWAALAYNVHRPVRLGVTVSAVAFFAGWLVGELAVHHVLVQLLALLWLTYQGALDSPYGWGGAMLTVASMGALMRFHEHGHRAGERSLEALSDVGVDDAATARRVRTRSVARPFRMNDAAVSVTSGLRIGEVDGVVLEADVFRSATATAPGPVLVYVHGGGWTIGFRRYQGLPILNALARLGFVCVRISYRLSPRATFPEHAHDVLRGIAWARAHANEYGGDPRFLAIAGNSAGAHLAAIAALAHDDPGLVPDDLRGADLHVDACIGLYGIYDFTNRHAHWPGVGILPFVERLVMKRKLDEHPELYRLASPIDLVRPDAPPFLLIHGNRDSLAPVDESRRFVEALRAASTSPVSYLEVEGAQHAFEIFHSIRGRYAVRTIAAFLSANAKKRSAPARDQAPSNEVVDA